MCPSATLFGQVEHGSVVKYIDAIRSMLKNNLKHINTVCVKLQLMYNISSFVFQLYYQY
jgi:hypothetical protein